MDFTDTLRERKTHTSTKNKRPISEVSIKTYDSCLRNIYKRLWPEDTEFNADRFKEIDKVMEYLNTLTVGSRKQKLCVLIAIEPAEEYKKQILIDSAEHAKIIKKAELTEKLEESAITDEDVAKARENLKFVADVSLKKKKNTAVEFTMPDMMAVQNWVLFNLFFAEGMVPRRSMDYYEMKVRNYNPETDNYYDAKTGNLVFNKYKTAFAHGTQQLKAPKELKALLKKWIALIPDNVDYMLFNQFFQPLTSVSMCQRWNYIFGGRKSINSIRHYFLTSRYQDAVVAHRELENTMEAMGGSVKDRDYYIMNPKA
jgi:hypothetical protein